MCLTLCDPPGFSVHEVLQARTLEWVAISFSGDLPDPGPNLHLLHLLCRRADSLPLNHLGSPVGTFPLYMYVGMCVNTCVCACVHADTSQIVRTTEKIEAGKRIGSTRGWAGVVLNRVIRLTVTFEQSPEEARQQALGQGHIQLEGTAASSVRRAMPVVFSTSKEAMMPSILGERSQAEASVPEGPPGPV